MKIEKLRHFFLFQACGCRNVDIVDILDHEIYPDAPYCSYLVATRHINDTIDMVNCALNISIEANGKYLDPNGQKIPFL